MSDLQRETEIADLQKVMSLPQGRRLIWKLLQRASILHTPFRAGFPDSTDFNLGMQNFGLGIMADLMDHTPAEYLIMQQEAMHAEKKRKEEQQPKPENDPLSGDGT